MVNRGLYWFRNDLRVQDNVLLHKASEQCSELLLVYIVDPRQWFETPLGFPKTGPFRTQFLIQSLSELNANLSAIGGDLHFLVGFPEEILPSLVKDHSITQVFLQHIPAFDEMAVESKITIQLKALQVPIVTGNESSLLKKDHLEFNIQELPDSFTRFRVLVEKKLEILPLASPPSLFPAAISTPSLSLSEVQHHFAQDQQFRNLHMRGGENSAQERLHDYFWRKDLLRVYKETRNGLLGMDYSSKLSPWLSLGCISARQIYWELKRYENERLINESTYWLFFELLWRDYFQFVGQKQGAKIFSIEGFNGNQVNHGKADNIQGFYSWMHGTTDDAFVNANMKELRLTGFMSNRGRQNVASYLVHELNCNWTWGAMYFESMLIDYDVFSNWGNWAYLAGVGNDPRGVRKFNTALQAQTYDPDGNYTRHWNSFV